MPSLRSSARSNSQPKNQRIRSKIIQPLELDKAIRSHAQRTRSTYWLTSQELLKAFMDEWEYLRVSVSYRADGRVDYISKKGNAVASVATHDKMEASFNILQSEWEAFLQNLRQEGWELVTVEPHGEGRNKSYSFKRPKINAS